MSDPPNFSNDEYDWRISDKQHRMISDKIRHLSKKEASLVIRFLEYCIFQNRASEANKEQKQELLETKEESD